MVRRGRTPFTRRMDMPDSSGTGSPADPDRTPTATGYDIALAVLFLIGLHNGLLPLVARLVFDGEPRLALTLRLPSPWWWIASLGVLVVSAVLLTVVDEAKKRHLEGQR
jgi:hypothetical protein